MYTLQYDLGNFDYEERYIPVEKRKPSQGELKRASRRLTDTRKFYGGEQEYKNGMWGDDKQHAENAKIPQQKQKEENNNDYINQISQFKW